MWIVNVNLKRIVKFSTDSTYTCMSCDIYVMSCDVSHNGIHRYRDEEFQKECTEEYLRQREEYRRTGIKKKKH